MAVKIIDRREGYDAMRRRLFGGADEQLLVGITQEVGAAAHGDTTVLQIALWNEFGTKYIPERPIFRGWFDKEENKRRVEKWFLALMPRFIEGSISKKQMFDMIGMRIVAAIQKTMTGKGVPPPNAASTISKKGSSTATVDTGVLRSKITHVVKKV